MIVLYNFCREGAARRADFFFLYTSICPYVKSKNMMYTFNSCSFTSRRELLLERPTFDLLQKPFFRNVFKEIRQNLVWNKTTLTFEVFDILAFQSIDKYSSNLNVVGEIWWVGGRGQTDLYPPHHYPLILRSCSSLRILIELHCCIFPAGLCTCPESSYGIRRVKTLPVVWYLSRCIGKINQTIVQAVPR